MLQTLIDKISSVPLPKITEDTVMPGEYIFELFQDVGLVWDSAEKWRRLIDECISIISLG
jgi:hypothetical protein